jgi:CRISPR-associated protein Csb2
MSGAEASSWVLRVHLHDARFHGAPEWPPSPARVFQALVAGANCCGRIPEDAQEALRWLEAHGAPVIVAPLHRLGSEISIWVPNNDMDAVGGDPARVSDLRVPKSVRPRLVEGEPVFHYVWRVRSTPPAALDALARRLHCLGRGVDQAWAHGSVLGAQDIEILLTTCEGVVFRPTPGGAVQTLDLACPVPGSFDSLEERHRASLQRFVDASDAPGSLLFVQPPRARFQQVPYDAPPRRATFELRDAGADGSYAPWEQTRVVALVEWIRDSMADRLRTALPDALPCVEQALVGRHVPDLPRVTPDRRVRLVPLPSIGHQHVDRAIRRVVVEVPPGCPLRADDVFWSASGLEDGERVLQRGTPDHMLERYGFTGAAKAWRSVTPVALPPVARAEHGSSCGGLGGRDRLSTETAGIRLLAQALRHAGLPAALVRAQLRREPWTARGAPARSYAPGTRFSPDRLWHVELELSRPIAGPLVLGDGRFLGLGVFEPVVPERRGFAFDVVEGWSEKADARRVAAALRRAVMARAQAVLGSKPLPPMLSGHEAGGGPALGHRHLAYACDPNQRRLYVVPPAGPHDATERAALAALDSALDGFATLRAGRDGLLQIAPAIDAELAQVCRAWRSVTPYSVLRHRNMGGAERAIVADVEQVCLAAGLPRPDITAESVTARPGAPLEGIVTLRFPTPVEGPLLLGRSCHVGGGFFLPSVEPES